MDNDILCAVSIQARATHEDCPAHTPTNIGRDVVADEPEKGIPMSRTVILDLDRLRLYCVV